MPSVVFRPMAEADLISVYEYVADAAGTRIAGDYIDRLEEACFALAAFPERGRLRDDIAAGLRTISVERRALIVYAVSGERVEIVRVLYGGRDLQDAIR